MFTEKFDVIIVGGGGAGCAAAVAASVAGARVAMITKEPAACGNTRVSGGDFALPCVVDGDLPEAFLNDLLAGGEFINRPELASVMAWMGRKAALLAECMGHLFERDAGGEVSDRIMFAYGGHSFGRTIASPGRGVSFCHSLRGALARQGVASFEDCIATRVVTYGGRVAGLVALDLLRGEVLAFRCPCIVLATGGAGWLYYPNTSCTRASTGDGFALALQAGAELVDMEQVQFIPFALTTPDILRGAVVGEPATGGPLGRLLNARGEVLLERFSHMTRAQVAKAMAVEIEKGNATANGGVILDLKPNLTSEEGLRARSLTHRSGISEAVKIAHGFAAYNWEEPWDVCPSAHYNMGGVRADGFGRSTITGLYAAGEVMGGLHGANRLGSVALTELFLFGERAGRDAALLAKAKSESGFPGEQVEAETARLKSLYGKKGSVRPAHLKRDLGRLMWQEVGPARQEWKLRLALEGIEAIKRRLADIETCAELRYNLEVLDAVELGFMVDAAWAIAASALERRESRGAHLRLDHPEKDDSKWLCNIIARLAPDGGKVYKEQIVAA